MHLFAYPAYTSDVTDFLNELRRKDEGIQRRQVQGRALLWDQDIDRVTQADVRADTLRQPAYVYQTQ